ncbi:MAG: hypothetical protein NTY75_00885 [Candidatus Shapirobacteria bacterium]|nr:hypothetical protein [Candidatus Shapirobacteria bacterium]
MNRKKLTVVGCLLGITIFWLGIYIIGQQIRRQKANQPQIIMVETAKEKLANGAEITSVVPVKTIDMAASLEPFMIIFNENGEVATASVRLDGKTPTVPKGVLNYAKSKGVDKITWQPKAGVRNAIVVKPYPHGWILAGRSLKQVETEESKWEKITLLIWLVTETGGYLVIKKVLTKPGKIKNLINNLPLKKNFGKRRRI